jgi:elongator complex protein 3
MISLAEKIIISCSQKLPKTEAEFSILKRNLTKDFVGVNQLPDKTELLSAYHKLTKEHKIKTNQDLERLLIRRGVRSGSGVAIVTSLIKPYPCPGKCVYCPLDERMPKSYLSDEPAAARALTLEFDPYDQMVKRLGALENNGHPNDKIEFILKGGTWNSYPLQYQYWFIMKSFEACNTFKKYSKLEPTFTESKLISAMPEVAKKLKLSKLTETSPLSALKKELLRQQKTNEKASHRIIGLTLETRPDYINHHTIWIMRELGATRMEIGLQHTSEEILELIKRGHTVEDVRRATELLRNYGFKTDFHLMPQLPGSTPEIDLQMIKDTFDDPGLKPDMIKLYPCSVVKGSELYDWFVEGKFKTYPTRDLIEVLKKGQALLPRYVRVSRLIRDIPGHYIEEGNKVTNLRQVVESEMKKEGIECKCLRCREVSHVDISTIKDLTPVLFIDEYETNGGKEYFLSFEDKDRKVVFAFCRLRIIDEHPKNPAKKVDFRAFIRELHTYGQLLNIGEKNKDHSQHKGLGKKLLQKAEEITRENKVEKLAVIAGVGVREYYRKWGYRLEKTYVVKKLTTKKS